MKAKLMTTSILGLILLVPGTYFMLTFLLRIIFGSTTLYYGIAPAFLRTGSEIFSFQWSEFILYGPLIAIILNLPAILEFQWQRNETRSQLKVSYRRYWLNTAIALQSILLFITLIIYLVIQHYRY